MEQFSTLSKEVFNEYVTTLNLPAPICTEISTSLKDLIEIMRSKNIGSILVLDQGVLKGIISERDIIMKLKPEELNDISSYKAEDILTRPPLVLGKFNTISDALYIIHKREFRHIPVVDENNIPLFVISVKDLLKLIASYFPDEIAAQGIKFEWKVLEEQKIDASFTTEFTSQDSEKFISGSIFLSRLKRIRNHRTVVMDYKSSLKDIYNKMREKKAGAVLLVEYETSLKGIITERDFLIKIYSKVNLETETAIPYMTKNPDTLLFRHRIAYAINNMFSRNYRNVLITDEGSYPQAIITMVDIVKLVSGKLFTDISLKKIPDPIHHEKEKEKE